MKKIIIGYWHLSKYKTLDYEQNQEFEFSKEKRNEIIDNVLEAGFNVMIRNGVEHCIIYIDNGRFDQS